MKKKGIIILSSVVMVCAIGLLVSNFVDWDVDSSNASGNIAKSSRFSRKTAVEGLSNMEELFQNDDSYKRGIVTAYMVMQTRAKQFDALVEVSNEVAGDIEAFADVLKDMNKVRPMIDNVCASLASAGEDLNNALGGQQCPDMAQNTINASLAYTTLQKQNKLADRFIATTDDYLKNNEGSDRLKFVRDQWLDYQQMTAALEKDAKAAEELQKKGYQLPPEKTAATLGSFDGESVMGLLAGEGMCQALNIPTELAAMTTEEMVSCLPEGTLLGLSDGPGLGQHVTEGLLGLTQEDLYKAIVTEEMIGYSELGAFTGEVMVKMTDESMRHAGGVELCHQVGETVGALVTGDSEKLGRQFQMYE